MVVAGYEVKERGSLVFLSDHLNVFPEKSLSFPANPLALAFLPMWTQSLVIQEAEVLQAHPAGKDPHSSAVSGWPAAGTGTTGCGKQESRLAGPGKLQPGLGPCLDLLLLVREV